MDRLLKRDACPYRKTHCHGQHPKGDMMCPQCYDDYLEINEKEKERGLVSSSEEGGERT